MTELPAYPPPHPDARVESSPAVRGRAVPPVVLAAAVVTYVCCAVVALMTVFFLIAAAFVGSIILDQFVATDRTELVVAVVGSACAAIAGCALGMSFAWHVTRRRQWARVALATSSVIALAGSLIAFGPHTVVMLPGSAAVLVLLFLPNSNRWFRESVA
ncbi:MAG TPA: hypothetical protein VFE07_15235 [Marmoricola sp.]|nr:hypothetical protein [Marmoricola sp.]